MTLIGFISVLNHSLKGIPKKPYFCHDKQVKTIFRANNLICKESNWHESVNIEAKLVQFVVFL